MTPLEKPQRPLIQKTPDLRTADDCEIPITAAGGVYFGKALSCQTHTVTIVGLHVLVLKIGLK